MVYTGLVLYFTSKVSVRYVSLKTEAKDYGNWYEHVYQPETRTEEL